jgi:hypothetical protein
LFSRPLRTATACVTLIALGSGVAVAQTAPALAVAQSTPAPVSSPTTDRSGAPSAPATSPVASGFDPFGVKGLTISGTLRAYDFNRINTPEYNPKTGAATGPNRQAFNFGGVIRADYKIGDSPFSVGGAFWGADPFGLDGGPVGCNVYAGKGTGKLIVNEYQALCAKNNAGIDNSLPGYALETFEYYVKYHDKYATASVGNQLLNKAWFPSSDSISQSAGPSSPASRIARNHSSTTAICCRARVRTRPPAWAAVTPRRHRSRLAPTASPSLSSQTVTCR